MLAACMVQLFSNACFDNLRQIVMSRLEVYRTDFSQSSTAITPLVLQIKEDANPIHVKICKVSDNQWRFLHKLAGKMLEAGLVYRNPNLKWWYRRQHQRNGVSPSIWDLSVGLFMRISSRFNSYMQGCKRPPGPSFSAKSTWRMDIGNYYDMCIVSNSNHLWPAMEYLQQLVSCM